MTIKCPRTQTDLKEITLDGIKLDISEKCGGVWFDNLELKKVDEAKEEAGDKLVEILKPYIDKNLDLSPRIKCPRCTNIVMMRNFYSPQRSITIDTCPGCGGIWLDPGELTQLRQLFSTEEEKNKYGQKFVDEVSEKALSPLLKKAETDLEQARKIANALKYICPSYYIKGKQDWGAF